MSVGNGKPVKQDWDTGSSTDTNMNQSVPTGWLGNYTTSSQSQQGNTFFIHATTLAASTRDIFGSERKETTYAIAVGKVETLEPQQPTGLTVAKSTTRKWLDYAQRVLANVTLVTFWELAHPQFIEVSTANYA